MEFEHPIFAKSRAPANLTAGTVSNEVTMLTSISNTTHAKSSDNSEKHPAANNDAFTCSNQTKCFQIIPSQLCMDNQLRHRTKHFI